MSDAYGTQPQAFPDGPGFRLAHRQRHCLRQTRALAITCPVSWQSKSLAATQGGKGPKEWGKWVRTSIHVRRQRRRRRIIKYFRDYKGARTKIGKDRRLKLKASEVNPI